MAKRREKTLQQLYRATGLIPQPEITPILKGSWRMQGPVDETERDTETNTVSYAANKELGGSSKSQIVSMRAESGTCNVCSAPCSSCLHITRVLMGSKSNEFSDETCQGNAGSLYSTISDVVSLKSSAADSGQHTACESSNLLSINSNHDSFSENSKHSLRCSDSYFLSEDVGMEPNLSSGGNVADDHLFVKPQCSDNQRMVIDKLDHENGLEGHEDCISCVSGANTANQLAIIGNKGREKMSYGSAASASSSVREESKTMVHFQTSKECCLDGRESLKNSGTPSRCTEQFQVLPPVSSSSQSASRKMCLIDAPSKDVQEDAKVSLGLQAEIDDASVVIPTEPLNFSETIEAERVKESELRALQETSVQSQPGDECDESDIVEHDVKVCDICGDAGREDLLAICSRCSDGAEHTYCMRDMVDKVPEGNWLCEECKFDNENKDWKEDKSVMVSDNDKNQPERQASVLCSRMDSVGEASKIDKDTLSTKLSGKRPAENVEVTSAVKKHAVSYVGSPKASSPNRTAILSPDSSFRNLEKGKLKPAHHLSFGPQSISDTSETAVSSKGPKQQSPQGTLIKSNSFNFTNAKPRAKLGDEVVLQKQKSCREPAALDKKEGPVRLIGKSMSFKSVNSGRINPPESKVKMLSPKFSHIQDPKGLKQAKERSLLERKNSFRSERPMNSCMGNPTVPVLKGESKRQSCSSSVAGASSVANDVCSSAEQKPNQSCPVDYPLPSISRIPEKLFGNSNEGLPTTLVRLGDSADPGERMRENCMNHSKLNNTTGGRNVHCQKCNKIGHAAEFCTLDNQQSLDDCTAKSSREELNKGNKLKAAIEAAMLKKPGICRKIRVPEQSNGLLKSTPNLNLDVASKGQLSAPSSTRTMFSADKLGEGQAILQGAVVDLSEQTTSNNLQIFLPLPTDAVTLKTADSPIVPSDGGFFTRLLSNHASAMPSVPLRMSAIPEHEYIWLGGFEIHRSGKIPELHNGIQAHISTCASPKVLDVARKFPQKMLLDEVPRLSTWPKQFQEAGATEDNIALYFFAKDLESYEKSYMGLLETLMKNDLALKGSFDGVELLIFPSNQLPEKSQRWNMLFFLWGVFKGKKVHCLENVSGSQSDSVTQRDTPTLAMSSPEHLWASEHIDKDLSVSSGAYDVHLASKPLSPAKLPFFPSDAVNGDAEVSRCDLQDQCMQANAQEQDSIYEPASLCKMQTNVPMSQEIVSTSTPMGKQQVDPEGIVDAKLETSISFARRFSDSNKSEKIPVHVDFPHDSQHTSLSHSSETTPAREEVLHSQVKPENTLEEEVEKDALTRDLTTKQYRSWQFSHRKRQREDPDDKALQAHVAASKKQRTGSSELYASYEGSKNRGPCGSLTHDVFVKEGGKESCNETEEFMKNKGTAERYFFPIDPHPVKDFTGSSAHLMPWEIFSSKDDDGVPNLELALGAEGKPTTKHEALSFLAGKVDQKCSLGQQLPLDLEKAETSEEDVSACLSLSLSFPFPDKEKMVKPDLEAEEHILPERKHVSTSLLLFKGFSDKYE